MASNAIKRQEVVNSKSGSIDVNEKLPLKTAIPLSFQHLFAMFGSSVLVPILFNVDPAIVLFFNGIGTLLYAFITKKKIPAYLGSSFAFIAPVLALMGKGLSFAEVQSGFVLVGVVLSAVAILIGYTGVGWIKKVFPPASMGAIVAIIGLELVPVAADMAGFAVGGSNTKVFNPTWAIVSMITLLTVIFCNVLCRGFMKIIPILIGIIVGYVTAIAMGLVDFAAIGSASLIAIPKFTIVKFNMTAIITIVPAAFVVMAEHIGHLAVTGNIVGRDLTEDPGLHRSMLGDGLSTIISGFFGSVPTTTYGENIGVLAITKVYSVYVIMGAGALSIVLGFSGKLAAIIKSVPTPVIGGVSLLLFGTIAIAGFRTFVEEKVDFSKQRNLMLTSVIFVVGLSGMKMTLGTIEIKGMVLATLVGVVLNLVFIILDKLGLMNEAE
ncbi:uracil permease [Clostridium folliculivorans]|uniref:Uracil/xanthine transporter n=1 Tax=Clostridium folliculivorans TaxID=2886038 RepID=A0A9W6DBA6_9CLOT|nr:uracil permease [Clostridium folliculivorans]GKU25801.1 uracil/xanthine transporter [Clostridium folliculivorans]GKU28822.1 uracil/xanthine transporter [Clostridium folliculivorans]